MAGRQDQKQSSTTAKSQPKQKGQQQQTQKTTTDHKENIQNGADGTNKSKGFQWNETFISLTSMV